MKNKVVDPHGEIKKENQRGSIGWDAWERMSASTLKPLTKTSHHGIWSMKVRWIRSCTAHQSLWLHLTHHQENQDWTVTWMKSATWSQAWRRQRLLVMCLHIRKLKEIFTGIVSLENCNNKVVLKLVGFFFYYSCLFDYHYPTSICREFRAGLQTSFNTTKARFFCCCWINPNVKIFVQSLNSRNYNFKKDW